MEVARITREAAATGNINSSRTQLIIGDAAVDTFFTHAKDAAQFTFNATESHGDQVTGALRFCVGRMADMIRQELESGFRSTGEVGILNRTRDRLAAKKEQLIDDYAHGMMGSEKMKKEGTINIVQNNSPGGIQQVGSNFNQSVFNQTHQSLVKEIDKALASPEFKALRTEDQLEVRDLADAVKLEAEKAEPDAGKLKRWGDKLVKMTEDVGLKFVSSTIAALLLKMYTGV